MDIDKIQKDYPLLVGHMRSLGMGRVVCNAVEPMVHKMVEKKGQYVSYPDFFVKFIDKEGINGKTKRLGYYRATVRRIWAFDEYGHLPNKGAFMPILPKQLNYRSLNDIFKKIVDDYENIVKSKMLDPYTVKVDRNIVISFLAEMQRRGAETIEDITPQMIVAYFIKDGEYIRGNDIAAKLKKVLSNYTSQFPSLSELLKYIPKRKDVVNLQELVPDEDIKRAKEALNDKNSKLSLRDKAIIAIVLYTGMRGTDVAKLTLDNIDWTNDRIKTFQSKTDQLLILPLSPIVGNMIFEYIVKERPNMKTNRLFYNMQNIEHDVNGMIVGGIIQRFFEKLGIGRHRVRALRHYIASKLLSLGTEPAIISSILGHIDPETINHYLDMDIENLRECALDISIFPLNKDIFK